MNAAPTQISQRIGMRCTFAELMDLYEINYARLRLLLPDLRSISDSAVSEVPDCIGLYLQVVERSHYTTTLRLYYAFPEPGEDRKAPYLKIRIYHDARTAEAMTGNVQRDNGTVDFGESLETRWRRNRFLYKWLGYCLRRGHRFRDGSSRSRQSLQTACELTV
jgi:uncharacterized protein YqiB (DUF1249 family)